MIEKFMQLAILIIDYMRGDSMKSMWRFPVNEWEMLDIISKFKENTDSKEPDNIATNLVQCRILELYRILTYFNNCSLLDSVFSDKIAKNYSHLHEWRCQC